jgi:hypothetical protein
MVTMAVALFALWNVSRRMVQMQTAAAASTGQHLVEAKAGTEVKVVLQLMSVGDGSAEGVVLEKQSESAYRKTSQTLRVRYPQDVSVVMGSTRDIRKDAVMHVTGTMGDDKLLYVSRIVILTSYVSVQ